MLRYPSQIPLARGAPPSSRQNHYEEVELQQRDGPRVTIREDIPYYRRQRRQFKRIAKFQRDWETIKADLPPQLTREHIGMISIGGVIGTGLFVGSPDALRNGGPVGALLAYMLMGTVVYSLCVSVGEIISFLPNVGGVVGLADLYVDPALGFTLGWAAWYNWAVTLPVEITAAAIVVRFWDKCGQIRIGSLIGLFLATAVGVNLFPSRVYGRVEFWLSAIKVFTIVLIILCTMAVDFGANKDHKSHGFESWKHPFATDDILKANFGIDGGTGRFWGFWLALMQAGFSFFGSDVPGIAAGEVIDATTNVPRALKRVWRRIIFFYIGSILAAGLLLPTGNAPDKVQSSECPPGTDIFGKAAPLGTGNSSPFVTIFRQAGIEGLPDFVNAAILLSAWSAAASDVYISSRFLFFLARQAHAPAFLAQLIRHPRGDTTAIGPRRESGRLVSLVTNITRSVRATTASASGYRARVTRRHLAPTTTHDDDTVLDHESSVLYAPIPNDTKSGSKDFVLPLFSVIVSSSVGLLAFMNTREGGPTQAFQWMGNITSVASLQSWTGMLFTYLRIYHGSVYAEKNGTPEDKQGIQRMRKHRHRGQPYLAYYAISMCFGILITNGSFLYLSEEWRIANQKDVNLRDTVPFNLVDRVPKLLSAYIPLFIFTFMFIGYKLAHQTRMVAFDKMSFAVDGTIEPHPLPRPNTWWRRLWYHII